jgi:hypothetical protein
MFDQSIISLEIAVLCIVLIGLAAMFNIWREK